MNLLRKFERADGLPAIEDISYISKPYAFDSEEDFYKIVEFTKDPEKCNLDGLYWLTKSIWANTSMPKIATNR